MKSKIKQFRDPDLEVSGKVVGFYEREFYPLSNFSSFQVEWRGRLWPTSEHAYQAAHFFETSPDLVEKIFNARSAHEAYTIAKGNPERKLKAWHGVKIQIMEEICRAKMTQHEYVRRKLLATEDVPLVEDSPKDSFWGWGADRQGQNELGKVWMKLRDELRSSQPSN